MKSAFERTPLLTRNLSRNRTRTRFILRGLVLNYRLEAYATLLREAWSARELKKAIHSESLLTLLKPVRLNDLRQAGIGRGEHAVLSPRMLKIPGSLAIATWTTHKSWISQQPLARCCCEMSASASRRDNTDRSLARSAWESVPRKNRPVGYGMIGRS